jgi:hypothetical protein
MKLKDVIEAAGNRLDWISFHWDWNIDHNDNIIPVMPVNINMDSDVSIHYQWFHHCDPHLNTTEVYDAIKNHDYNTFYKWFSTFENDQWTYLPSDADIWVDDEYVGRVCVAYRENLFALITSQDHECG